jgi:hypothetical protein
MMPRAANRITYDKAFDKRCTRVGADSTDREHLRTASVEEHRFAACVPEQHRAVRDP